MAKKSKQPVSKGNQEMIETLNKSEAFFNKNKKAILTCLIALVLIVVGVIAYNNYVDSRNEKASTVMAKCQDLFAAQDFDKALKGDSIGTPGFIQIASDYSGTKAGNLANLYAGLCYAKLDKWEEAVKYFDQFSPKSDMMVSPMSVIAMGDAYANVKQLDKAVDSYKKAAKMADGPTTLRSWVTTRVSLPSPFRRPALSSSTRKRTTRLSSSLRPSRRNTWVLLPSKT